MRLRVWMARRVQGGRAGREHETVHETMHARVRDKCIIYLYRACSAFGRGEGDFAQIPSLPVHVRVIMTKCDWPFLGDNMPTAANAPM